MKGLIKNTKLDEQNDFTSSLRNNIIENQNNMGNIPRDNVIENQNQENDNMLRFYENEIDNVEKNQKKVIKDLKDVNQQLANSNI